MPWTTYSPFVMVWRVLMSHEIICFTLCKCGNFPKISAFYELYVIFVLKYLLLGKRQMEQFSITRFKCVADILDKDPEMP